MDPPIAPATPLLLLLLPPLPLTSGREEAAATAEVEEEEGEAMFRNNLDLGLQGGVADFFSGGLCCRDGDLSARTPAPAAAPALPGGGTRL